MMMRGNTDGGPAHRPAAGSRVGGSLHRLSACSRILPVAQPSIRSDDEECTHAKAEGKARTGA